MSPLFLVGILLVIASTAFADVKHVLEGSAHPPDPNSISPEAVNYLASNGPDFWWMEPNSPLKAAYDYYKKCSVKGNCLPPVNPNALAPHPFRPQDTITVDIKNNPFFNGEFTPSQGNASYSKGSVTIDISKNPFLSGVVVTTGSGTPVVKGQDGFLGVQPSQPFGKGKGKPGFATAHPLEQQKKPFGDKHPLEREECKGAALVCVKKDLCEDGVVNRNGEGILQIRIDVHYCSSDETCCRLKEDDITPGKSSFPLKASATDSIPVVIQPEIFSAGEHGHHSGSTPKSIRATSSGPNSVFGSTVDYSNTRFGDDVRFASTFQGPAYLPPVGPTTKPPPRPFETPSINQGYYTKPQTTARPPTTRYIPPITTARPTPSTTRYVPPQTTPRPTPPTTRYVPSFTTPRPAPSTFRPAPSTSREYLPPYRPTPGFSSTQPSTLRPYQPPVTQPPYQPSTQRPYQPPVTTQRPYQPPVTPTTPRPYQPPYQPSTQRPYQPPVTTQRPYQPPVTPSTLRPYQPPVTQPPYQPSTQRPYQPPVTTQRPYQPPVTPSTPRPYQPPYQPSTQKPYQPPVTTQRPYQPPSRPYEPPVTQRPYQPPQTGGYDYPKPTPTFGYPTTPRPDTSGNDINNQYYQKPTTRRPPPGYLPPAENPDQVGEGASNFNTGVLKPSSPRPPPPFNGEQNTAPPPGCAAALKCVQEIYCTAEGVVSPVPVVLTKQQEENRVPTTVCQDTESGIIGKCCRDPNYKDPWPSANLVDGVDDGQYKEDDSLGQYTPDLQRNVRSDKLQPPTCGQRHPNSSPPGKGPLDVSFAEIPWQAMILRDSNRSLLCGGVIVRRDAVLTAAHCVDGLETSDILIKGGEWKLGIDEEPLPFQIVRVKVVVRHPQYQKGSLQNDLALLVLEEKLRLAKNVGTICLPQPNQIPTENCIATGWGKRILQLHAKGAIMHSIDVNIMDNAQCQETLASTFQHALDNYSPNTLCGFSNRDQCRVDYGSALACYNGNQYVLSGIYSWDTGCKQEGQIGGYVAPDVEWIESTLAKPIRELKQLEQQN